MGRSERPWFADRCPWGLVYADPLVRPMLHAYASVSRFSLWPPGPRDMRTEIAMHMIAGEHDAADDDARRSPGGSA